MTALSIGLLLTTLMERSASRGGQRLTFWAIVAPFFAYLVPGGVDTSIDLSMLPTAYRYLGRS